MSETDDAGRVGKVVRTVRRPVGGHSDTVGIALAVLLLLVPLLPFLVVVVALTKLVDLVRRRT